jgi:hypothetical protein
MLCGRVWKWILLYENAYLCNQRSEYFLYTSYMLNGPAGTAFLRMLQTQEKLAVVSRCGHVHNQNHAQTLQPTRQALAISWQLDTCAHHHRHVNANHIDNALIYQLSRRPGHSDPFLQQVSVGENNCILDLINYTHFFACNTCTHKEGNNCTLLDVITCTHGRLPHRHAQRNKACSRNLISSTHSQNLIQCAGVKSC